MLFSNGSSDSSFVLEDGGKGIEQKIGCFSGSDAPCSSAADENQVLILGLFDLFLFSILRLSFISLFDLI